MTQDPVGLRLHPLHAWLESKGIIEADEALTPSLLAGGRSNVSYRLHGARRDLVVRRPPLGNILPTAHDMGREHTVLSGLHQVGYPVPQPLGLCDDANVIGAPFMVMKFVDGRTFADEADTALLSPRAATDMSRELVDTLAKLHQIDPAAANLDNLGRPDGYLVRQVKRWGEQWKLTQTRNVDDIDALHHHLSRAVGELPRDLPSSIVHGDYRIDNVIWDARHDKVVAVLDWEMATLGDPVSDLAITLVYWSQTTDTLRAQIPVAEHITEAPGFWTRDEVINRYAQQTGFSIDHLDTCVAIACFKLAVIMESIHKRNLEGQQLGAASHDGGRMGLATTALARMGCRTIEVGALQALGE